MKRYRTTILYLLIALLLGQAPRASAAPIVNGNFDSGGLAGWVTSPAAGGGSVQAVAEFALYVATGQRMALLQTGSPGAWTTLSQTFDVPPGAEMGCSAFFVSSSPSTDDSAQVRLLTDSKPLVVTFDYNGAMFQGNHWTPIISWTHPFTMSGRYTLEARVRDAGAGISYMGLDSCYVNQRFRLPLRQPLPPR